MSCGKPGDFEVTLEVKELVLSRDAGIAARPYWTSDYRTGTKIQTILCTSCKAQNVAVTMSVSADVGAAKEIP